MADNEIIPEVTTTTVVETGSVTEAAVAAAESANTSAQEAAATAAQLAAETEIAAANRVETIAAEAEEEIDELEQEFRLWRESQITLISTLTDRIVILETSLAEMTQLQLQTAAQLTLLQQEITVQPIASTEVSPVTERVEAGVGQGVQVTENPQPNKRRLRKI